MFKFIQTGIICLCLFPVQSYATLGENISSIHIDNEAFSSDASKIIKSTSNDKYQVFTIKTTKNITIKEYVSDNKVFAISWNGHNYPDFNQLLGTYFPQLKTATNSSNGLTQRKLNGKDFIFYMNGLPNMLSGITYIPSLIPNDINIYNLK